MSETTAGQTDQSVPAGVVPITRDNHFVPQGLLRRWSSDGVNLPTYSLLVSNPRVPYWSIRSIKGLAMHRDLYTIVDAGSETDAIERWLASEFEHPGLEASEKLLLGHRLSRDDWHAIIRLYACQELRTPQSFVESRSRWDKDYPALLENTMAAAIAQFQEAKASGRPLRPQPEAGNEFSGLLKVNVHRRGDGREEAALQASIVVGRRLWLASIRHVLNGKSTDTLLRHTWNIRIPFGDLQWPLTDHPALRLGFRSEDDYSFAAGWGQRNADLMMPLSPRHLLHVQVGAKRRGIEQSSEEQTRLIQRMLLLRAHRLVFATSEDDWIVKQRPRTVNRTAFEEERDAWGRWHAEQSLSELERTGS